MSGMICQIHGPYNSPRCPGCDDSDEFEPLAFRNNWNRNNTKRMNIQERSSLATKPNPVVFVSNSEDGLSLALSVSRSQLITNEIEQIASSLNASDPIWLELEPARISIEHTLKKLWVKKGMYYVQLPNGDQQYCYVTKKNLNDLISPSLLTKMIPTPYLPLSDFSSSRIKAIETSTQFSAAAQRAEGSSPVVSTAGNNRFLHLSVNDMNTFVVGRQGEGNNEEIIYQRDFHPESLLLLNDCQFSVHKREINSYQPLPNIVARTNFRELKTELHQLFSKKESLADSSYLELEISLSKDSIVKTIIQLAKTLESFHRSGKVHGDIKPQNVLITSDDLRLIDDLDLRVGGISPAVSPIWGAPEQLTTHPVLCSTDIYPIGVMLVGIIEGQITGEIGNYAIPSSTGRPKSMTVIRDPMIYVETNNQNVPKEGLTAWLTFIERCMCFDPTMRFASGGECARSLEALNSKFPIQGRSTFQLENRGPIDQLNSFDGSTYLCHIISDDTFL